jgi:hypothetical protein
VRSKVLIIVERKADLLHRPDEIFDTGASVIRATAERTTRLSMWPSAQPGIPSPRDWCSGSFPRNRRRHAYRLPRMHHLLDTQPCPMRRISTNWPPDECKWAKRSLQSTFRNLLWRGSELVWGQSISIASLKMQDRA